MRDKLKQLIGKMDEYLERNPLEITLYNHERKIQKEVLIVFVNDCDRTKRESSRCVNFMRKSLRDVTPAHVCLCYNTTREEDEEELEKGEDHFEEDSEKLYTLLERNCKEKEDRSVILIPDRHGMILTKKALDQLRDEGFSIDGLSIVSFGSWNAALDRSDTQMLYELFHVFCEGDVIDVEDTKEFLNQHYSKVSPWDVSMEQFEDLFVLDCSLTALKTGIMPLNEEQTTQIYDHFLSVIESEDALTQWLEKSLEKMESQGLIFLPDSYNRGNEAFLGLWDHYINKLKLDNQRVTSV